MFYVYVGEGAMGFFDVVAPMVLNEVTRYLFLCLYNWFEGGE